jgi:hypothetical protein
MTAARIPAGRIMVEASGALDAGTETSAGIDTAKSHFTSRTNVDRRSRRLRSPVRILSLLAYIRLWFRKASTETSMGVAVPPGTVRAAERMEMSYAREPAEESL